jgi:hypothetical protein
MDGHCSVPISFPQQIRLAAPPNLRKLSHIKLGPNRNSGKFCESSPSLMQELSISRVPEDRPNCILTGGSDMKKVLAILGVTGLVATALFAAISSSPSIRAVSAQRSDVVRPQPLERPFDVDIIVDGRRLTEYYARGKSYVEAIPGAEYEIRVSNPLPYRVAVALSVDGLNTIDARHTTAWNASKWVIQPYGSINISGWQMSSERARRFYFTSERDSYGAKLGQTSNLGVISVVYFREREPRPIVITPPYPQPYPRPYPDSQQDRRSEKSPQAPSSKNESLSRDRAGTIAPEPDDEYAATGIGRSVQNDVRWINMELDSRPAAEVTIRYEYYPELVRLGIYPRPYPREDSLRRRERASGFEDRRFSPEP